MRALLPLIALALAGCAVPPPAQSGRFLHARVDGIEGIAFQLDANTKELCQQNLTNWPRTANFSMRCSDIDASAGLPAQLILNGVGWPQSLTARFQTMPMCEFVRSEWARRQVGVSDKCLAEK